MRVLYDMANADSRAHSLIIFLPGALQQPEDLLEAGFAHAVRQRHLQTDVALLDMGLQYIGETTDGSALTRLHEFISMQAAYGYRSLWLAGISIGGFMAMAYAQRFPGKVHGLCLLSPYPGNRLLTNEIRAAGSLQQWQASCSENDSECQVWHWLKSQDENLPQIYYGYGKQDRFAEGQQLMAHAFDAQCVDVIEGAHDWPTWQSLWSNFLNRAAIGKTRDNTKPCN